MRKPRAPSFSGERPYIHVNAEYPISISVDCVTAKEARKLAKWLIQAADYVDRREWLRKAAEKEDEK